ncbi:MAG TPA: type II toxin-antitoxin system VapC family toxin [Methanothrix sp.]|nr:type II toxin-antitoxin system VapC family toxin [Methanothrix sp.]HPR65962.1 type II toxin-antitoxin system VapC family toxin [Methanothrix sp.]
MPILDTSFLVDLLRRREEALALLAELEGRGASLCTTPITALELYRGAFLSANPERSLAAAKKLLDSLAVLPLDDEAAIVFGALAARLRSEGRRIGDFDEVIAAIALAREREIVTRDEHFREVAGLSVVGW